MLDYTFAELFQKHPYATKAYGLYLILSLVYIIRINRIMKTVGRLPSDEKTKYGASLPDPKKWNPLLTYLGMAVLFLPRFFTALFFATAYMISAQYLNN
jgi:hypothetical protein